MLFKGKLSNFLDRRKLELKKEVEGYTANYILNVSEEDLCQYLVSKYSLKPPKIYEDKIYAHNPEEVDVDVSRDPVRKKFYGNHPSYVKGVQIIIAVPFEGDEELFQYLPSTFNLNPPRGKVVEKEIHLIYETVEHDEKRLKQKYQQELDEIRKYLKWVEEDVNVFNNSLDQFSKQLVSQRKKKLLDALGLVSSLGIPIKRREDLPETYTIPSIRKKLKFEQPQVSKEPFKPEPVLELEEYENILETSYDMALAMERSPRTFSKLNEEEIRDFFLLILNAHYEGQATGETFNYGGKTDILIRFNGKNVFIAECKFWAGEKKLLETIDQLLSYTSWRDTKTAIFLFYRNRKFSSILKKLDLTVKSHPCNKRERHLKNDKLWSETIFSYLFHQPQDVNREVYMTVMAFNVPK